MKRETAKLLLIWVSLVLLAIISLTVPSSIFGQEKARIPSRQKIEQRIRDITNQIDAENDRLQKLIDPIEREKLVTASATRIREWTNVLEGLKLSVRDTTLSAIDTTQAFLRARPDTTKH